LPAFIRNGTPAQREFCVRQQQQQQQQRPSM
jgi:hypothetical protein